MAVPRTTLKPFWRYYGGKWRAALKYPPPRYDTIIEPFAGAAGYSCRYPDRNVILVDKYETIAEIWRYLIAVPASEILRIPCVDAVADLPAWVPQPARDLVGFHMNNAVTAPRSTLSARCKKDRAAGSTFEGWSEPMRQRVASQVDRIRHWQVIYGEFYDAPDIEATWFVDPPYNNKAGSYYVHSSVDYRDLALACRGMEGQVIVCENVGANWLPFRPLYAFANSMTGKRSSEAIWTNDYDPSETLSSRRARK